MKSTFFIQVFSYILSESIPDIFDRDLYYRFWNVYLNKQYTSYKYEKHGQMFTLQNTYGLFHVKIRFLIDNVRCYITGKSAPITLRKYDDRSFYFNDKSLEMNWDKWLKNYQNLANDPYPITSIYLPAIKNGVTRNNAIIDGNHRITKAYGAKQHPNITCIDTILLPRELFCSTNEWLKYLVAANFHLIEQGVFDDALYEDISNLINKYVVNKG